MLQQVDMQWESQRDLRQRCCKGLSLMVNVKGKGPVMGTLANITANHTVLAAITGRMAQNGVIKTPPVDSLSALVFDFYVLANFPDTATAATLAHQDAWAIKRCLTTLRRKWQRHETPRVPSLTIGYKVLVLIPNC